MVLAVVGAGMVGCATALALKKRGHDVVVFEKRADPRTELSREVGRSINLAISARGLRALASIDPALESAIRGAMVPMRGRMVHTRTGELDGVAYGISGREAIHSIGRAALNDVLMNAVESAGIAIEFSAAVPADAAGLTRLGRTVFACDGTYSKLRGVVARQTDFKLEMETVGTYYMEVPLPVAPQWPQNYLHVWPRGTHMFIALPNPDGTFTGTLFAPRELFKLFGDKQSGPAAFAAWFEREFPDAAEILGWDVLTSLSVTTAVGRLTSVKCAPYNVEGSLILLGDAAHSMVPFYGQGLNAGLEDVRVLMEHLDRFPDPQMWAAAFDLYSRHRKPDLDAINDLSMQNYKEMRDSVATLSFRVRKYVDNTLARWLGDRWLPLYTMVSFRSDVRYSRALAASHLQQKIVDTVVKAVAGGGILAAVAALTAMVRRCRALA